MGEAARGRDGGLAVTVVRAVEKESPGGAVWRRRYLQVPENSVDGIRHETVEVGPTHGSPAAPPEDANAHGNRGRRIVSDLMALGRKAFQLLSQQSTPFQLDGKRAAYLLGLPRQSKSNGNVSKSRNSAGDARLTGLNRVLQRTEGAEAVLTERVGHPGDKSFH